MSAVYPPITKVLGEGEGFGGGKEPFFKRVPSPIHLIILQLGREFLELLVEKTGPSTQTSLPPMLQRPQMPMPHFMRFSSVV